MRLPFILIPLALAACTPSPAPPASQPAAEPPAAAANAALLAGPLATGQWFARSEEGTHAAGFGVPESEYQFVLSCTAGSGALSLMAAHELMPDQATTLSIVTANARVDLPARSFNEGLPSINADLADESAEKAALTAALAPPQERFAIEAAGETTVYPWDESLARVLSACR